MVRAAGRLNSPDNWYNPTGVAITRASYNGQCVTGSNGTTVPIVYTVFNYSSITAGPTGLTDSNKGATFVAFEGNNPLVRLAASGPTASCQSGGRCIGPCRCRLARHALRGQRRWHGHG